MVTPSFISDQDYRVVIGDAALRVVSQTDPTTRRSAELQAQEEIASYLRPKYDVEAIFSAQAAERNSLIVLYTCDIALYHMVASSPQKMGTEVRQQRYERAVKWLEGVQAGKIIPDLPLLLNATGVAAGAPYTWHAQPPLHHNW